MCRLHIGVGGISTEKRPKRWKWAITLTTTTTTTKATKNGNKIKTILIQIIGHYYKYLGNWNARRVALIIKYRRGNANSIVQNDFSLVLFDSHFSHISRVAFVYALCFLVPITTLISKCVEKSMARAKKKKSQHFHFNHFSFELLCLHNWLAES